MLKFKIEQVALNPEDSEAAIELLTAMGAGEWVHDHVVASGVVFGVAGSANEADLSFEYDMLSGAKELEVLTYTDGNAWMHFHEPRVSHLGMHCSEDELLYWKFFFANRKIRIAQEVFTETHSNPFVAGKSWYNYVIFDTYDILGVDIKFIVRKDAAPE